MQIEICSVEHNANVTACTGCKYLTFHKGRYCGHDGKPITVHAGAGTCPLGRHPHLRAGHVPIDEAALAAAARAQATAAGKPWVQTKFLPRESRQAVAFSLFGSNEKYARGAIINAATIPHCYPGWAMLVYHDDTVPRDVLAHLKWAGAILQPMPRSVMLSGKFWRFRAAADARFDRVIMRDIDSFITPREIASVKAWLASDLPIHLMRNWSFARQAKAHHEGGFRPIQAGMWGAIVGTVPGLLEAIDEWQRRPFPPVKNAHYWWDEWFLREMVWPEIEGAFLMHCDRPEVAGAVAFSVNNPHGWTACEGVKKYQNWHPAMANFQADPKKLTGIHTYWHASTRNVGDTLTPHLIKAFKPAAVLQRAAVDEPGKLVAVGSILNHVRTGDTVWGTGAMYAHERLKPASACRFLAVRGKLTRKIIIDSGGDCPEVYGDPALLLPLVYQPTTPAKQCEVGYVPHYVDRARVKAELQDRDDALLIDVEAPWREVVDRIASCDRIVSSSLHGIIIAEAYGVPAEWAVYSDKVLGDGFKFRDYLTGTGREIQPPGPFPQIADLAGIQRGLVDALDAVL